MTLIIHGAAVVAGEGERVSLVQLNGLDDLFTRRVDEHEVQFVRPAGTDRPIWAVYDARRYLGTLNAEHDGEGGPMWRVLATREGHASLDDAVRALRRPASWPREREEVARWARRLSEDDSLLAVDLRTEEPGNARMVRIAVVAAKDGTVVFDEHVQPQPRVGPAMRDAHRVAPERNAQAPAFGALLPLLGDVLGGSTLVSYDADADRAVLKRELIRHYGDQAPAEEWLARYRWEDAWEPCSVWRGLWSAKLGAYCAPPLGDPQDAAANCLLLLAKLEEMSAAVPEPPW
ncbi:3'-5' exonuclease [Streptomyces sp. L2]|uniref:3'-5' exonuclease n=1 Tax=Streptomyces sp. L2 TaxID=2162665 RepID=UPI001010FA94|nr:3'-5' exonuclease [Streptomyces sp. L2]